jgi:hypothetical protein
MRTDKRENMGHIEKVNEKAYADCILALRECKPTEGIEILENLKIALVNSYQKQLDEQKIYGLFNLFELHKDWEEFIEDWKVDTLKLTPFEERIIEQLTSEVLPRHMPIHDWNLPYAEACILVLRRLLISIKDAQNHPNPV